MFYCDIMKNEIMVSTFCLAQKMDVFSHDPFLSRVASVSERSTLLSVIGEFRLLLEHNQLNSVEYCATVQTFLSQMKASIFGQLTEQEFLSAFVGALSVKFPQDTLSLIIHSIGVGDFYKFSKTISLLELLMVDSMREVLISVFVDGVLDRSSNEMFARDICSVSDRVYNFLGSSVSSNEAVSMGEGIVRKFEKQLLQGIQLAIQSVEPVNISICSKIVVSYCMASDEFSKELISWILSGTGDLTTNNFGWEQIFLNSELDYRRQEQLVAKLVHLSSSGDMLKKLFGDSPVHDSRVKRIFVNKLLVERLSQSQLSNHQRISQKIACYFTDLSSCLASETLLQLLHVFSDQSQFLESVSFAHQLQLCTAILDFAKKIREEDYIKMRQEVMQFLASAIPEYLQMADSTRRQMGMFLAETLANRFGCTKEGLHFEYSKDCILDELRCIAGDNELVIEPKSLSKKANVAPNTLSQPKKLYHDDFRALVLLDSDDDDESFDQPEQQQANGNFLYLRNCIDHLGAKESYINFEKALRALPRLLQHRAAGEPDVAQELLDRMICLEDRFRLPEFMELRTEVTSLLFANHPELVAGAIRVLFSNQCCMSNRYFILACVEKAAHRLTINEKSETSISAYSEDEHERSELGKVVWRKSKTQTMSLSRNDFLPVATLFICPLMDLKWEGVHLDLYDRDHILLGKILVTVGKLVLYAKFAPSHIRIVSALFALLYRLRSNKHGFVFNGVLFCYASIAESLLEVQDVFTTELQDCMEWISDVAEEKVSIDPNVLSLVQTTLRNIGKVLKYE